ncbi:uncharacterized protein [Antedon mediterranea]|uniref:uncharacterized protein n=1 Tax=Antedon mediterranea TaxID=105859 RepID=UPI003AF439A5
MYTLLFLSVFVLLPSSSSSASGDGLCGENEFTCLTSRDCIDSLFVCDKDEDCADGSDEYNCMTTAHFGQQVGDFFFTTPPAGGDYSTTDPCNPNPCGPFGECNTNFLIRLLHGEFKCDCFKGHKGQFCDIDLCDCGKNGECKFGFFRTYCECEDGYSGKNCENGNDHPDTR